MATDLISGRMVGPYRLLFRLGKGGMGEVWAAQRGGQFGFERLVALKLLRGVERGSNAEIMFRDEARAAGALQHAAIVPTFDLGQYGETFYIAMGMVRGPSLTALLQRMAVKKTPLPPAIVAYVGERIASALDYAYDRAELDGKKLRLIHRDISPHNVLIDDSGNVLLMDFGVARTAVQDHESRVGTVRGKPSYMAPEQVTGGAIDARTDVFALGVVLYESACVKRLFGRSNPVKSMEAVLHYTPKPLDQLIPDFPEGLWKVIEKSLAKDPDERYQTAGDFGRALSEVSRELAGSATAGRDLAQLAAESFPAGSFDVEARVKEALAQAQAAVGEAAAEVLEATKYEPRPQTSKPDLRLKDVQRPEAAFAEGLGTRSAWPAAMYTADPLAPDALAEVQAQMTSAQAQGLNTFTPTSNSASFQSYSQVSASSHSPVNRGSRAMYLAVTLSAAVVIAAGTTMLLNSQTTTIELPAMPTAPGPFAEAPRPMASGEAEPTKPEGPTETAPEKPESVPAKAPPAEPVNTKVTRTKVTPNRGTQDNAPPAQPKLPVEVEPAQVGATEVIALVNNLVERGVLSKQDASAMRLRIAEMENDPAKLMDLRRELKRRQK